MISKVHSVYNAQSVYNQGSGDIVGPEIGGIKYPVTRIGNQIWITKNIVVSWPGLLDFSGNVYDNDTNPRSVYPEDKPNFYGQFGCFFGRLYNGFAVDYIANPNNGILPDGWRVPSQSDLEALVSYIGATSAGKINSVGYWSGGLYTDDFGFSLFPAGWYEKGNGNFKERGNGARLWSTTTDGSGKYYIGVSGQNFYNNTYNRNGLRLAASVRVMRDA